MEFDGVPVERLWSAFQARQRAYEARKAKRQAAREATPRPYDADQAKAYREAHKERRNAYMKQYYQRKKLEAIASGEYVPKKRGRPPKSGPQAGNPQAAE